MNEILDSIVSIEPSVVAFPAFMSGTSKYQHKAGKLWAILRKNFKVNNKSLLKALLIFFSCPFYGLGCFAKLGVRFTRFVIAPR